MYCIVYSFKVKEGMDEKFVKAWSEVTRAYIDHAGGLGSRLHQTDSNEYIAYAQWPSEDARNNAKLPDAIKNGASKIMRECCDSISTLYQLTSVVDLLVK